MNKRDKLKNLSTQFMRYFAAALVGYVFDFGTLIFCTEVLQLHYLISATTGFIIGLIVVYLLSNRYVFGESKLKSRTHEFVLFTVIGVIGLGILNCIMWLFTELFAVSYILSKIIATIVVYAWNFLARRTLYHD